MSRLVLDVSKLRLSNAQRKMIAGAILLTAGLALVTIPAQADDLRDFIYHNDTSREITAMATSTPGDNRWHTVTGEAIPPHLSSRATFKGSGPCVVQLKIQFNDDPRQEVSWTDGFDLCSATSLHLSHGDNGKYYIRPKEP
jgi:hypothetical protein